MSRKGQNIYKRKDGRWEGRYVKSKSPSGKTQYGYVYAKTYRDAKEKLLKAFASHSQQIIPPTTNITCFSVIASEWLNSTIPQVKESTVNKYRNLLQSYILPIYGDIPLSHANPSAIAQGLVKRMLAEIRSYGVGLVIADQSPRKVSTDVIGLTDMKVVFRLVESVDKQIIADSMNMSDSQVQRLSRLKPGEAFLFFNKLDEPEEVVTPDYRLENNISITLTDEGIRDLSTYWRSRKQYLKPYPECNLIKYCSETCDYDRRILAKEIARRIYTRNFNATSKEFEPIKKVFRQITNLTLAELNDEPFSPELLACVKCQLWRRIKYGTNIPIKEIQIKNSLEKS